MSNIAKQVPTKSESAAERKPLDDVELEQVAGGVDIPPINLGNSTVDIPKQDVP